MVDWRAGERDSQREGGQLGRPGLKAVEKIRVGQRRGISTGRGSRGSARVLKEVGESDCSLFRQWSRFRGRQLEQALPAFTQLHLRQVPLPLHRQQAEQVFFPSDAIKNI